LRTTTVINIDNPSVFKQKMLAWSQQFREIVYLDSNNYPNQYSNYDCVLAVDAFTSIKTDYFNAFEDLKQYQQTTKDWLFGHLSYDLKNNIEDLHSNNFDGLGFPDLYFFQPKKLFLLKENNLEIKYLNLCDDEIDEDLKDIENTNYAIKLSENPIKVEMQQRISKEEYLLKLTKIFSHINLGDIYEANFCMEFFAENAIIDPIAIFTKLNAISEPPFAVFLKNDKQFLLSASPERYLKKDNTTIISQPIKGTARRSTDFHEDDKIKNELFLNEKERSENIMIVDLVRNDLSKTAQKGSVAVIELCQPHTFKQVHHLISTVTSQLNQQFSAVDVIKSTFPMGSMTGAPKISAMKIIEELEETKRGLYSGAVGYFSPEGDFDFNVVIRSILYNQDNKYLSFSVGSAVTAEATAEKEYEECMLKANAMLTVLT
jgi:para-aminobenzoate synthetase component 1